MTWWLGAGSRRRGGTGLVMSRIRSWLLPVAGAVALAAGLLPQATGAARDTAALDWPQFLHDPQHSSVSQATAFTLANAGSVTQVWHWKPPVISGQAAPHLDASPTVVAGRIYIGAESGGFYALNESTGAVEWSRRLDTCPRRGITATAAVEPDPGAIGHDWDFGSSPTLFGGTGG